MIKEAIDSVSIEPYTTMTLGLERCFDILFVGTFFSRTIPFMITEVTWFSGDIIVLSLTILAMSIAFSFENYPIASILVYRAALFAKSTNLGAQNFPSTSNFCTK